jgi:23S rRNA (uracil1939-C5)-methyltransferase
MRVPGSMFMYKHDSCHVESCVLLERVSNRKTDARVRIDVDLEDYYRIKAGQKNRIEE